MKIALNYEFDSENSSDMEAFRRITSADKMASILYHLVNNIDPAIPGNLFYQDAELSEKLHNYLEYENFQIEEVWT